MLMRTPAVARGARWLNVNFEVSNSHHRFAGWVTRIRVSNSAVVEDHVHPCIVPIEPLKNIGVNCFKDLCSVVINANEILSPVTSVLHKLLGAIFHFNIVRSVHFFGPLAYDPVMQVGLDLPIVFHVV